MLKALKFKSLNSNQLISITNVSCFHQTSSQHATEKELEPKQVPFYTFVDPNKRNQTSKDRLYVWGYTATGALGIKKFNVWK
jgi:hypothetical protein